MIGYRDMARLLACSIMKPQEVGDSNPPSYSSSSRLLLIQFLCYTSCLATNCFGSSSPLDVTWIHWSQPLPHLLQAVAYRMCATHCIITDIGVFFSSRPPCNACNQCIHIVFHTLTDVRIPHILYTSWVVHIWSTEHVYVCQCLLHWC